MACHKCFVDILYGELQTLRNRSEPEEEIKKLIFEFVHYFTDRRCYHFEACGKRHKDSTESSYTKESIFQTMIKDDSCDLVSDSST